jgi:hypothetical protein
MVDAVESTPGTDPDRAGFTVALQAARDRLIRASRILPEVPGDAAGGIAIAVLDALMPGRRPRTSARKVKCPTSRYAANPTTEHPLTSQKATRLDNEIHTRAHPDAPSPPPGCTGKRTKDGRRNQVLRLLRTEPHRPWHATEVAHALGYANYLFFARVPVRERSIGDEYLHFGSHVRMIGCCRCLEQGVLAGHAATVSVGKDSAGNADCSTPQLRRLQRIPDRRLPPAGGQPVPPALVPAGPYRQRGRAQGRPCPVPAPVLPPVARLTAPQDAAHVPGCGSTIDGAEVHTVLPFTPSDARFHD